MPSVRCALVSIGVSKSRPSLSAHRQQHHLPVGASRKAKGGGLLSDAVGWWHSNAKKAAQERLNKFFPVYSSPNWKILLCHIKVGEIFNGRFSCTQGVTPGSWEVTAGLTTGTVGQPKTLLQTQPGYGRLELQDCLLWRSKQGCAGEFLSAQVSARQPKGTGCSVVRLSPLIKNTNSKPRILNLRVCAEGK